jgi:hypothetical protein
LEFIPLIAPLVCSRSKRCGTNRFVFHKGLVMNKKLLQFSSIILLAALLLSGCQFGARRQAGSTTPTLVAVDSAADQVTATPQPSPTRKVRPSITPSQDTSKAQLAQAEQAAHTYFDALSKGNLEAAVEQVSQYSLMVFGITSGDAVSELQQQKAAGSTWSDLSVLDSRVFDPKTILVHVRYTITTKDQADAKDELWPMRLESTAWHYNFHNLIDFRTVEVDAKSVYNITVKPTQMNRYSDHIELVMMMQNSQTETLVLGQTNEILGNFYFSGLAVEAEKTKIVLIPQRTKTDAILAVKGLYTEYPDTIEIRKWRDYKEKPWFTFALQ